MAVISIRLNKEEEKMVQYLADYFEEEKSTLIKHSLKELYEDLVDKEFINDYEQKEKRKKAKFINAEELRKNL